MSIARTSRSLRAHGLGREWMHQFGSLQRLGAFVPLYHRVCRDPALLAAIFPLAQTDGLQLDL